LSFDDARPGFPLDDADFRAHSLIVNVLLKDWLLPNPWKETQTMAIKFSWIKGLVGICVLFPGPLGAWAEGEDPVRSPGSAVVSAQADSTPEEIGDALMVRQRYEAAIAAYKKMDPIAADVWNKLGIANQLMFNQQEASRCYQESIRLNPKNPNTLNNLGTLYDSMKRFRDAEKMFQRTIEIAPGFALAYKNLGTSLLSQHQYQKGWVAYQKAQALDPAIFRNQSLIRVENPGTAMDRGAMNYFMAKGCVRAGMNDCAIDHLRRALNEGFTNVRKIGADTEFAGLRGLPAFDQLLAAQGP
jgi:tetratricopeptide (TPR) repeat protein